nr:YpbS family protein [Neobacillus sp. Marseille-Q6967]
MSVHKDLINHAANQNKSYQEFLALDQLREQYIQEAVELCKQGKPFSTDKINAITNKMNKINLRIVSIRKNVTVEMVQEYVKSL